MRKGIIAVTLLLQVITSVTGAWYSWGKPKFGFGSSFYAEPMNLIGLRPSLSAENPLLPQAQQPALTEPPA